MKNGQVLSDMGIFEKDKQGNYPAQYNQYHEYVKAVITHGGKVLSFDDYFAAQRQNYKKNFGERPIGATDVIGAPGFTLGVKSLAKVVLPKVLKIGVKQELNMGLVSSVIKKGLVLGKSTAKAVIQRTPMKKITSIAKLPTKPLMKSIPIKISNKKFVPLKAKALPGTGGMVAIKKPGIIKQATGVLGGLKGQFDRLPAAKKIAVVAGGVTAVAGAAVAAKAAADNLGITKTISGLFKRTGAKRKSTKRKSSTTRKRTRKKKGAVKHGRSRRKRSRGVRRRVGGRSKNRRVSFTTRDGRRVSFTPRSKSSRRTVKRKRSRRSWAQDRRMVSQEPWEQSYRRKRR